MSVAHEPALILASVGKNDRPISLNFCNPDRRGCFKRIPDDLKAKFDLAAT